MSEKNIVFRYAIVYVGIFSSFAVMAPYLQLFLRSLSFTSTQIGLLLGSFEIAGIFGPMVIGRLGDKTGLYKLFLIIAMIFAIIFYSLLLVEGSFFLSLLTIFFLGFFYKNNIPLTDTLASHGLPGFKKNYGLVRVAGSISFVFVSFILSVFKLINASLPTSILFWFITFTIFQLLTLFLISPNTKVIVRETRTKPTPLSYIFWLGIGVVFVNRLAMSAYYSFFFIYIKEIWQIERVGIMSALASFAEIPFIFLGGYLVKKFGYSKLFLASLLGISARMMINAFSPLFSIVMLGQLLHCLTFGVMHASIISFIQENTDSTNRGVGMAVYMSIGAGVSGFIGSATGGYIVDNFGFTRLFFIYGIIPLLGIIPISLLRRTKSPPVTY